MIQLIPLRLKRYGLPILLLISSCMILKSCAPSKHLYLKGDEFFNSANKTNYSRYQIEVFPLNGNAFLLQQAEVKPDYLIGIADTLNKANPNAHQRLRVFTHISTFQPDTPQSHPANYTIIRKQDITVIEKNYTEPGRTDPELGTTLLSILIIGVAIFAFITLMTAMVRSVMAPFASCFIATMVYGSYDAPEVLVLRKYRDEVLLKSGAGTVAVLCYYLTSPYAVKLFKNNLFIKRQLRKMLDHIVFRLSKPNVSSGSPSC